ncbi:MAG: (2Fe-2S)-binding protein [Paenibacillus sp.]|nr:(2Fe-2S)-binding protein [Paenibacillus sp.]
MAAEQAGAGVKEKTKYRVCSVQDVPDGGKKIVEAKGMELGIYNVSGRWQAWRNLCPHAAAPVCEGVTCGTRLPSLVYEYQYGRDREIIRCPWHGWEFDLLTGKHLADNTGKVKLRGYEVQVVGDDVYVLI